MPNQIRTLLRDEYTMVENQRERGSRYWTAAELLSQTWFVVESCIDVSGKKEIRRWVTTSIHEAAAIQRGFELSIWSQIFVCTRVPVNVRDATVFEVLNEAYYSVRDGSYVYRLGNGMSFIDGERRQHGAYTAPTELKLVYAQGR
jgi:hypothetical protein